jgi:hypothetical protein
VSDIKPTQASAARVTAKNSFGRVNRIAGNCIALDRELQRQFRHHFWFEDYGILENAIRPFALQQFPRVMTDNPIQSMDAIVNLERRDSARLRKLTFAERSALLASACRTAAAIEASRLKMGLPPVKPAPWPQSTWDYLAECARRVHKQ